MLAHAKPRRKWQAVRNVEKATHSEPVNREELLESEKLKRKLREAKHKLELRFTICRMK